MIQGSSSSSSSSSSTLGLAQTVVQATSRMSGLCILTFTILTHIIPGSVCHVDSATSDNLGPGQYGDDHHLRRLTSDPSSSEAFSNPRDMINTLIRDVGTLLKHLNYGLLDTTRQRYKRSLQARTSLDDSRMKQLWDAFNRHKNSQQVAEDRNFFFPSFDAWASSFTMYFWRDMAFNVFKIVGLSALYYLAPGVLAWYTDIFGNT